MISQNKKTNSWLDIPISRYIPEVNFEFLLVVLILAAAVISRFYHIDLRVMSHDEVNHVVPSWDLFQGRGYRHDPVTHGPLQFHLVALSYFIFGDNDFSSRVPSAIFSVATVAFVLLGYRRYLGRSGSLIAGFLFLVSPFLLYYGRYTRNEAYVALFAVIILYSLLRYLEKGNNASLYLFVGAMALNFTAKETAFIYAAQAMIFLAVIFFNNIVNFEWFRQSKRNWFIIFSLVALLLMGILLGFAAWNANLNIEASETDSANAVESEIALPVINFTPQMITQIALLIFIVLFIILAIYTIISEFGWQRIKQQRSFHLLIVLGTLVLPQLAAFPIKLAGWNPLDYSSTGLIRSSIFVILFTAIAMAVGLWWNQKTWLNCAVLFYGIFTVLYTTFFTNGQGFFTGLLGSLGYWLSQQGVERGSQPWYYYAIIQLPVYEYLAVLGAFLAVYFGIRNRRFSTIPGYSPAEQIESGTSNHESNYQHENSKSGINGKTDRLPVLSLLVFWSITSLIAYSIAGEKMPWLTVHIAIPLLLTAAWGFGYLVDTIPWKKITEHHGLIALLLSPVFVASLGAVFSALFGNNPPFEGNTTVQLQSTTSFVLGLITVLLSGGGILYLLRDWLPVQVLNLIAVVFFVLFGLLTIRTSYFASYINYDNAKEYLVYAHAARGPKDVLEQVEEISRRTTGGLDVVVAYDNDGLYPYWWYFRNYPNHKWYTDKPTRDLKDAPLIIAGDANIGKLDSIVKDNYIQINYIRLWWPNQDYWNLTWERIVHAVTDREMRAAIFNIWLNRDYTQYALLTNNSNLTLENWQPSSRMRFYIRKDIVAQMWKYGSSPEIPELTEIDPYEKQMVSLSPDSIIGIQGNGNGELNAPRGMAVAQDGTIYVADSQNHRIQQFSQNGEFLNSWGEFADVSSGQAPGGTFNEPWGIALAQDGSVFVTDTWNHRVQKFSSNGEFIKMWGNFGQGETSDAFWGPRGIVVDSQNRVFITDTGNKRIVVFSTDGEFITQFGSTGVEPGQFDEPVGIAINGKGSIYIADTWNQRVQVFTYDIDDEMPAFIYNNSWDVNGWFGQSLDNKPFIAVDDVGNVFITDPEGYRVLEFSSDGSFIQGWGDYSAGVDGFGLPSGITTSPDNKVWVSDAGNHRLLQYTIP